AFLFIGPLEIIEKALFPLASVLSHGASFMLRPILRGRRRAPSVSEEELQSLVKLGRTEGTFDETEAEIINKTIRFADLRAREIMTPRTEIVWLERSTTLSVFLKVFAKTPHMRFPVFDGEQDNVVGILAVRDILRAFADGRLKDTDRVAILSRPAHFFPETKPVDNLLKEMRGKHDPMVLLVDEHGSIAGLLTLQQIVGEIVGDITDEGTEADFQHIDEKTIQIEGSMRLEEANVRLHLGLPEGEYETLAGFLLARLGRIPRQGEQIGYDGLRFTISEMRGVKIERVKVTRS
ncbi:MAG: HlyC/CorC family transporter, partial [Chloroflexi bacterium]|nr:HlyC/CorC family transporter [Chloroflexota bacterium]